MTKLKAIMKQKQTAQANTSIASANITHAHTIGNPTS